MPSSRRGDLVDGPRGDAPAIITVTRGQIRRMISIS